MKKGNTTAIKVLVIILYAATTWTANLEAKSIRSAIIDDAKQAATNIKRDKKIINELSESLGNAKVLSYISQRKRLNDLQRQINNTHWKLNDLKNKFKKAPLLKKASVTAKIALVEAEKFRLDIAAKISNASIKRMLKKHPELKKIDPLV